MRVKTTPVYESYWRFATERQNVFFKRLCGDPGPWTQDKVIAKYKFTNVYRATDRVSQYLIRNVLYAGDQSCEEIFFRAMIFKMFNKIKTWELLCGEFGIPTYKKYTFKSYNRILSKAQKDGKRLYSAAYIMPSGKSSFGFPQKHKNNLKLIELMMRDKLAQKLENTKSMSEVFSLLEYYPTIGPFLAYQYAIDLNYSVLINFSEMDFVFPGPGAYDGINKCFSDLGGYSETDIIKYVAESQQAEFTKRDLDFQPLWGRPLQLIDCQNLFCEISKYARIVHPEFTGLTGRTRIKQSFIPDAQPIDYFFPPKWGLNERLGSTSKCLTRKYKDQILGRVMR